MEEACGQKETIHGPLCSTFSLPTGKDGKGTPALVDFVNPLALLSTLTANRPALGDLLRSTQGAGQLTVVLYADEAKPGNVLRPDTGRAQLCVYWTILELPDWFKSRDCGWWFCLACPCKLLGQVPGGLSLLFARVLDTFFGKSTSVLGCFSSGVHCHCSGGTFVLKATMGPLLADEKAIKEAFSLKGASGTKPCFQCQNVIGHCSPEEVPRDGWLVHNSCAEPARFVPHTPATFQVMVSNLHSARASERKKLGQLYGLGYTPWGVLWQPAWMGQISPITHCSWDWMHCLVTSGGVAQYELNALCCELQGQGISLSSLDRFASMWHLPRSRPCLARDFFSERVNHGAYVNNTLYFFVLVCRNAVSLSNFPTRAGRTQTRISSPLRERRWRRRGSWTLSGRWFCKAVTCFLSTCARCSCCVACWRYLGPEMRRRGILRS